MTLREATHRISIILLVAVLLLVNPFLTPRMAEAKEMPPSSITLDKELIVDSGEPPIVKQISPFPTAGFCLPGLYIMKHGLKKLMQQANQFGVIKLTTQISQKKR